MPNSWNIIGWLIITVSAFFVLRSITLFFYTLLRDWRRYRKTREVQPLDGQIWQARNGHKYYIKRTVSDRIVMATFNPSWSNGNGASWSDDRDTWKARVAEDWLYLADVWKENAE